MKTYIVHIWNSPAAHAARTEVSRVVARASGETFVEAGRNALCMTAESVNGVAEVYENSAALRYPFRGAVTSRIGYRPGAIARSRIFEAC